VRIDAFIFNPEESTSHKAIQVTHGVFRYVSGYVASDQDTKIATPSGQMGIRGSVAEGVVDPAVPDFVYLGEGNATFTNSAGSSRSAGRQFDRRTVRRDPADGAVRDARAGRRPGGCR
jgi:hypothetical protein